jgi:excisionase family DNA binding protein
MSTVIHQTSLLTVNEALVALSIGRTQFYALLKTGDLSAVKLGKCTRVKRDEIDRFISTLPEYRGAQ